MGEKCGFTGEGAVVMFIHFKRQLREKQRSKKGGEGVKRQLSDGTGGYEEERGEIVRWSSLFFSCRTHPSADGGGEGGGGGGGGGGGLRV